MKRLVLSSLVMVLCMVALAQVPESFSYQAIVRNTAGEPLATQDVIFLFSIIQTTAGGTVVYTEKHAVETNQFGLVNLSIGNGIEQTGDFTTIDWGADDSFLNVQVDKGDAIFVDMGTTQLLSVPYAMYAKSSATANDAVKLTGSQTIEDDKTFINTITGNITGNAGTVTNGVYTIGNQTISGNITFTGTTTVEEPVNATDAATKAYVDLLLERIEFLELLTIGFTDERDGNTYRVAYIGDQIWMAENLKYLPSVIGPGTGSETTSYYYVHGYDGTEVSEAKATVNYITYGVLYNWPALMNGAPSSTTNPSGVQGVCPTGWHMPSDAEWTELTDYLGGLTVAGGKLKEFGTTHWSTPNTGATNETDFTALPAGLRTSGGIFSGLGLYMYFWSATENDAANSWSRGMYYDESFMGRELQNKSHGFSVRCLKD